MITEYETLCDEDLFGSFEYGAVVVCGFWKVSFFWTVDEVRTAVIFHSYGVPDVKLSAHNHRLSASRATVLTGLHAAISEAGVDGLEIVDISDSSMCGLPDKDVVFSDILSVISLQLSIIEAYNDGISR